MKRFQVTLVLTTGEAEGEIELTKDDIPDFFQEQWEQTSGAMVGDVVEVIAVQELG